MCSVTNSLGRQLELVVLYRLLECRWLFKIVFNLLAALCAGAFVLLITGLMGIPGLCSFNRALSVHSAHSSCPKSARLQPTQPSMYVRMYFSLLTHSHN